MNVIYVANQSLSLYIYSHYFYIYHLFSLFFSVFLMSKRNKIKGEKIHLSQGTVHDQGR